MDTINQRVAAVMAEREAAQTATVIQVLTAFFATTESINND